GSRATAPRSMRRCSRWRNQFNVSRGTIARPAMTLRQQVYLDLRAAIERGTFAPGARLPPSREHARVLGVARNTVLWAVERLRAEGYVQARVGGGSYVAPSLAALRARAAPLQLSARAT